MKKKKRNKPPIGGSVGNAKESEMLLKIAENYMAVCDTLEKMNSCLNQACAAWNISLLPDGERIKDIDKHIDAINRINDDMTEKDRNDMRNNIELLISEKLKHYPDKKIIMLRAKIDKINGKLHVKAESVVMDKINQYY